MNMPPANDLGSKARTRILVVDDEPALCELVEAVLQGAGMEAHSVSSSEQAIERLLKQKYDAVFLDVWMPAPDGFEVAQRMRASGFNQKTPLVMITGDADPGVLKRGFESGANYFLFKPIDRRGLLRFAAPVLGAEEWPFICSDQIDAGDRAVVKDVSGNTLIVSKK